jgi:hypothetical protein
VVVLAIPLHKFAVFDSASAGKLVIDAMNYWPPVDDVQALIKDHRYGSGQIVQQATLPGGHPPLQARSADSRCRRANPSCMSRPKRSAASRFAGDGCAGDRDEPHSSRSEPLRLGNTGWAVYRMRRLLPKSSSMGRRLSDVCANSCHDH